MALVLGFAVATGGGCGKAQPRAKALQPSSAGEAGECASCGGLASEAGAGGAGDAATGGSQALAGMPAGGSSDMPPMPAPSLTVSSVTISQTLELPLLATGKPLPIAARAWPLVAAKRALLRAFVEVEEGFEERELIGVLDLTSPSGDDTLVSRQTIRSSSTQEDLTSTFDFWIEARDLEPGSEYRLRVLEADTTPLLRIPEADSLPLGAKAVAPFKLVLVPYVVQGVAPKFGAAEQQALRQRLITLFPISDVELSTAPSVNIDYVVDGDGAGWDDALDLIYDIRAKAAPADDVFYYGMMAPGPSFNKYCAGTTCQTGYSELALEDEVQYRGSIGITVFQDGSGAGDAWDTVAHELGHALGREHSPCDIPDGEYTDPDYPYPANPTKNLGSIYGYDFELDRLIKPRQFRDVMGYCTPVWISDYTFQAFYERIDYIQSESLQALAWAPPELYRVARIGRLGQSGWRADQPGAARQAGGVQLPLLDAAGRPVASVSARFFGLDHGPGGYVWIAARELSQAGAVELDLRVLGGARLPL